ncbi:unnamed protein product, partial [Amoebophrya sp. A120]
LLQSKQKTFCLLEAPAVQEKSHIFSKKMSHPNVRHNVVHPTDKKGTVKEEHWAGNRDDVASAAAAAHPGYKLTILQYTEEDVVTTAQVAEAFDYALEVIGIEGEAEVDELDDGIDLTLFFNITLVEPGVKKDPHSRMNAQQGLQVYVMVDEESGDKAWMDELVQEYLSRVAYIQGFQVDEVTIMNKRPPPKPPKPKAKPQPPPAPVVVPGAASSNYGQQQQSWQEESWPEESWPEENWTAWPEPDPWQDPMQWEDPIPASTGPVYSEIFTKGDKGGYGKKASGKADFGARQALEHEFDEEEPDEIVEIEEEPEEDLGPGCFEQCLAWWENFKDNTLLPCCLSCGHLCMQLFLLLLVIALLSGVVWLGYKGYLNFIWTFFKWVFMSLNALLFPPPPPPPPDYVALTAIEAVQKGCGIWEIRKPNTLVKVNTTAAIREIFRDSERKYPYKKVFLKGEYRKGTCPKLPGKTSGEGGNKGKAAAGAEDDEDDSDDGEDGDKRSSDEAADNSGDEGSDDADKTAPSAATTRQNAASATSSSAASKNKQAPAAAGKKAPEDSDAAASGDSEDSASSKKQAPAAAGKKAEDSGGDSGDDDIDSGSGSGEDSGSSASDDDEDSDSKTSGKKAAAASTSSASSSSFLERIKTKARRFGKMLSRRIFGKNKQRWWAERGEKPSEDGASTSVAKLKTKTSNLRGAAASLKRSAAVENTVVDGPAQDEVVAAAAADGGSGVDTGVVEPTSGTGSSPTTIPNSESQAASSFLQTESEAQAHEAVVEEEKVPGTASSAGAVPELVQQATLISSAPKSGSALQVGQEEDKATTSTSSGLTSKTAASVEKALSALSTASTTTSSGRKSSWTSKKRRPRKLKRANIKKHKSTQPSIVGASSTASSSSSALQKTKTGKKDSDSDGDGADSDINLDPDSDDDFDPFHGEEPVCTGRMIHAYLDTETDDFMCRLSWLFLPGGKYAWRAQMIKLDNGRKPWQAPKEKEKGKDATAGKKQDKESAEDDENDSAAGSAGGSGEDGAAASGSASGEEEDDPDASFAELKRKNRHKLQDHGTTAISGVADNDAPAAQNGVKTTENRRQKRGNLRGAGKMQKTTSSSDEMSSVLSSSTSTSGALNNNPQPASALEAGASENKLQVVGKTNLRGGIKQMNSAADIITSATATQDQDQQKQKEEPKAEALPAGRKEKSTSLSTSSLTNDAGNAIAHDNAAPADNDKHGLHDLDHSSLNPVPTSTPASSFLETSFTRDVESKELLPKNDFTASTIRAVPLAEFLGDEGMDDEIGSTSASGFLVANTTTGNNNFDGAHSQRPAQMTSLNPNPFLELWEGDNGDFGWTEGTGGGQQHAESLLQLEERQDAAGRAPAPATHKTEVNVEVDAASSTSEEDDTGSGTESGSASASGSGSGSPGSAASSEEKSSEEKSSEESSSPSATPEKSDEPEGLPDKNPQGLPEKKPEGLPTPTNPATPRPMIPSTPSIPPNINPTQGRSCTRSCRTSRTTP